MTSLRPNFSAATVIGSSVEDNHSRSSSSSHPRVPPPSNSSVSYSVQTSGSKIPAPTQWKKPSAGDPSELRNTFPSHVTLPSTVGTRTSTPDSRPVVVNTVESLDELLHMADDAIVRRRAELRNLQLQRQMRSASPSIMRENGPTTTGIRANTNTALLLERARAVVGATDRGAVPWTSQSPSLHSVQDRGTLQDPTSIPSHLSGVSHEMTHSTAASVPTSGKFLTRAALIARAEAAVAAASSIAESIGLPTSQSIPPPTNHGDRLESSATHGEESHSMHTADMTLSNNSSSKQNGRIHTTTPDSPDPHSVARILNYSAIDYDSSGHGNHRIPPPPPPPLPPKQPSLYTTTNHSNRTSDVPSTQETTNPPPIHQEKSILTHDLHLKNVDGQSQSHEEETMNSVVLTSTTAPFTSDSIDILPERMINRDIPNPPLQLETLSIAGKDDLMDRKHIKQDAQEHDDISFVADSQAVTAMMSAPVVDKRSRRQEFDEMIWAVSSPAQESSTLLIDEGFEPMMDSSISREDYVTDNLEVVPEDNNIIPSKPPLTATLRMLKELNRVNIEYTNVVKQNMELKQEVEVLQRNKSSPENIETHEIDHPNPSPSPFPLLSSNDLFESPLVNKNIDQNTSSRQSTLQHFLADLVGIASEHGDATAILWAKSKISSIPTDPKDLVEDYSTNHSFAVDSNPILSITKSSSNTPVRGRNQSIGSPHKGRTRMKSPRPTGRSCSTWKDYLDEGIDGPAMKALESVSAEYSSDVATYVVRKPHGACRFMRVSTSEEAFDDKIEWRTSVDDYIQNATVEHPDSLEIFAFIHDDRSVLMLQGSYSVRHGTQNFDDQGETVYEWKEFGNFNENNDLLGAIVYIDVLGNEREYLLDIIFEEAVEIRENYCSGVLAAATALRAATSKDESNQVLMNEELNPLVSTSDRISSSVSLSHGMDVVPENPILLTTLQSPETLPVAHEQNFSFGAPPLNGSNIFHPANSINDHPVPLKVNEYQAVPSIVPAQVNISKENPFDKGGKVASSSDKKLSVSSPAKPPANKDVVEIDDGYGSADALSAFLIFFFTTISNLILFLLVRLPFKICVSVLKFLVAIMILSAIWLFLADDHGAMKMGAGVNYQYVPPRFFERGI